MLNFIGFIEREDVGSGSGLLNIKYYYLSSVVEQIGI